LKECRLKYEELAVQKPAYDRDRIFFYAEKILRKKKEFENVLSDLRENTLVKTIYFKRENRTL